MKHIKLFEEFVNELSVIDSLAETSGIDWNADYLKWDADKWNSMPESEIRRIKKRNFLNSKAIINRMKELGISKGKSESWLNNLISDPAISVLFNVDPKGFRRFVLNNHLSESEISNQDILVEGDVNYNTDSYIK